MWCWQTFQAPRERSAEGIRLPAFYRPSALLCVSLAERGSRCGGSQGFPCAGIKNTEKSRCRQEEEETREREGGDEGGLSERASYQHTAGFHTSESETEKEFLGEVCLSAVCCGYVVCVCLREDTFRCFPAAFLGASGKSISSWDRHTFTGTENNPVVCISALLRYLVWELAIMWWPVCFLCSSFIACALTSFILIKKFSC